MCKGQEDVGIVMMCVLSGDARGDERPPQLDGCLMIWLVG